MIRYIARVSLAAAICVFIGIIIVRDANSQTAPSRRPTTITIGFIEPLPIDVVSQRVFKVCAYVKDLKGDPLKVIFTPQRSMLLSVSLAKANKCAWFVAPERRGPESIKIVAYEIYDPANRNEFKVPICILMDELFGGAAEPPWTYCPRFSAPVAV